jgi:hypothetical protein
MGVIGVVDIAALLGLRGGSALAMPDMHNLGAEPNHETEVA